MPTRKQKRRREKGRRHEYEYVYVDEEGHEVEVDEPEQSAPKTRTDTTAAKGTRPVAGKPKPAAKKQGAARATRAIEPPSWQRVFRRAAIFAPVMLLVVYFLSRKTATPASVIVQVAILLVFFVPFSYFLDVMMYRAYRKRIGDPLPPRQRAPRKPKT